MYQRNQIKKQNVCVICFKPLNINSSLHNILSINSIICGSCQSKFKVLHKQININGVNTLFLYEYNPFIKKLIYQYKGCYDIALKDVFLHQYKKEINRKYKDYIIVFPPSNKQDDIARGFKHIEMIISSLKIKYIDIFYKETNYKQSSHNFSERANIENIIKNKPYNFKKNDKYLIVDDIYTSGSTLNALINILTKNKVKKENISALIIAKTV